jgi:SPP1 family predicted phage head-tail adaptor
MDDFELAHIYEDIQNLMPDKCNILSGTYTSDGIGGFTQSWGTAYKSIPCRMDAKTLREVNAAGALQVFGGYTMTLPYNTTITEANRIEFNGALYNVLSLDKRQSWELCITAHVEAV